MAVQYLDALSIIMEIVPGVGGNFLGIPDCALGQDLWRYEKLLVFWRLVFLDWQFLRSRRNVLG